MNPKRLSRSEAHERYLKRSPGQATAPQDRLVYHLGVLKEASWMQKGFAEQVETSLPGAKMTAIINSNVSWKLEFATMSITELLPEEQLNIPSNFKSCWFSFQGLLMKINQAKNHLSDKDGRKGFFLLFLAVFFMHEAASSCHTANESLTENDVFGATTFPLTDDEKAITRQLPFGLFGTNTSLSCQLGALAQNLNSMASSI